MDNKKPKSLSWDDFILQGNPDAVIKEPASDKKISFKSKLKVHYERKGRGGKEAVIIRGFDAEEQHDLESICKTIKSKIGVGGTSKDEEIIIQGSQRDKIVEILVQMGFKDVKKAGG